MTSQYGDILKSILVLAALTFGAWVAAQAWNQTCLGIFEDKHLCEAARKIEQNRSNCGEVARQACASLEGNHSAYVECHDAAFCRCLGRLGQGCY